MFYVFLSEVLTTIALLSFIVLQCSCLKKQQKDDETPMMQFDDRLLEKTQESSDNNQTTTGVSMDKDLVTRDISLLPTTEGRSQLPTTVGTRRTMLPKSAVTTGMLGGPQSVLIVGDDKCVNTGDGLLINKDGKAISQYAQKQK